MNNNVENIIKVGNNLIGLDHPTYFIADIAANWDESLDRAKDLIYLAAEAGADAAKFQNFQADTIISATSFQNMDGKLSHQASWDESVYEVYDKASLPVQWTRELKETCDDAGIDYFTTPYSIEVVNELKSYVAAWKMGSGDITWHDHIATMAKLDMPLFIATGASSLKEVEMAMEVAIKHTDKIVLMQCNTNYTASLENFKHIALNVLKDYKKRYPNTVLGLSDHTPGHSTVLGSVALGARAIEKHFTDDTSRKGPDHKFSMDPKTWREMVDRTRELENALGPKEKRVMDNEKKSSVVQRRSIHAVRDIKEGEMINEGDLVMLRPELSDSFPPYKKDLVIGKIAKNTILKNTHIKETDI
jgi:sialic acid synthase SpsE